MGDNKEDLPPPVAESSESKIVINCAAGTSSTNLSEVLTGNTTVEDQNNTPNSNEVTPNGSQNTLNLPEEMIDNELLNKASRALIRYLFSVSSSDKSINIIEHDAKIDEAITLINARHLRLSSELVQQKNGLKRKKRNLLKKSNYKGLYDPSGAERILTTVDEVQTEQLNFVNLINKLNKERLGLLKKLNSMRRIIPIIDITDNDSEVKSQNPTDTKDVGDESSKEDIIGRCLQITKENQPVIGKIGIMQLVKQETKEFLNKLKSNTIDDTGLSAAEYNAKVDKVLADVTSSVDANIDELSKQKKSIQRERHLFGKRAVHAFTDSQEQQYANEYTDAARILTNKTEELQLWINTLTKERRDLVNKLGVLLKPVPIAEGQATNWHAQQKPSSSTKLSLTFKGQPVTAIVAANNSETGGEESILLKRLISRRQLELGFCVKQNALGHNAAHKAHTAVYELVSEIIDILTPLVKPKNRFRSKYKLCNLLLEKYPPRFSRDKVTLTAADAAEIAKQAAMKEIKLNGVCVEMKPIPENTTLVVPSDGGSQDEDQRNFTRRLNTLIEFDLGSARKTAANGNFALSKISLAMASALTAKPEGLRRLLSQLQLHSELADDTDNTEDALRKELAEANETEVIVENMIRELHKQIGVDDNTESKEPLLISHDRKELLSTAERYRAYFHKQGLAEFMEGTHYGSSGNLLAAGAKCVLGNDLTEKAALFRAAQCQKGGTDIEALARLIEKNRSLVPATYVPDAGNAKPVTRYTVPRDPPKPPKPAAPQQSPRPPVRFSAPPTSGPGSLSIKELSERVFGTGEANTDPKSGYAVLKQLRALGVPADAASRLMNQTYGAQNSPPREPQAATELKEFNPELPEGFRKIKIPGPLKSQEPGPSKVGQQGTGNSYPPRFDTTSTGDMEGPGKRQNRGSVTGLPSEIKLVAGSGKNPALMMRGVQRLSGPGLQSSQQGGGINVISSSNIATKLLPGMSQPSGDPKKLPLLGQPLLVQQPGRNQAWSQWRGNPPAQYTTGTNNQGLYPPRLSSAGSGRAPANTNNAPVWPTHSGFQPQTFTSTFTKVSSNHDANAPTFAHTDLPTVSTSQNSPTEDHGSVQDMFADDDLMKDDELDDGSKSPTSGQKRMSAFQRLGPVAAAKKPKLTINLLFSKDDAVREVVDEQAARETKAAQHVPVYRRADVLASGDHTVVKYLACWPWRHRVHAKRTAGPRASKSSMIMEEEQMVEGYESNRSYVKVAISKYPPNYTKEDVLDLVLETVGGESLIPCFIEFTREECIFLVLRCEKALLALHKKGLYLHDSGYDMPVHISLTDLTLSNIGFIPRIVLGKRLTSAYDGEAKLNLEGFCLESDVSHFVYFPLNRPTNQTELVQLQSGVSWEYLRELNLANNRLESLEGFSLGRLCPRLRSLDVSRNRLARAASLLPCRGAPLLALRLEGNPLCRDCTEPVLYTRLARLLFPSLAELDGVKIQQNGELPTIKQNYCPPDAKDIVEKFLEVYFPLLDSSPEERMLIEELYHERATLSITYSHTLRFKAIFRRFRDLFTRCRLLEEENLDLVEGAAAIARHVSRWPALQHDPPSFVVDVLHHDESSLVLRVAGALKVTSQSLAEDEHQLWFARTLVLHAPDGCRYRLRHEMLHWAELTGELAGRAFQLTAVKAKKLSLTMESVPDDDLKEKLVAVFMKVTNLDRKPSGRCLELRNWDFKAALEYFMKLLKLNSVNNLDVTED